MANVILFSSAFIRTASMILGEGTKKIRINLSTGWTREIRDKMDWAELDRPKGFVGRTVEEAAASLNLVGDLDGRNFRLTPNSPELKKHEIEFDISSVDQFTLVTVNEGDGKTRKELRFQVITTASGALKKLEQYAEVVGQSKGELRISHVKQTELDMVDMSNKDKQVPLQTPERAKATSAKED